MNMTTQTFLKRTREKLAETTHGTLNAATAGTRHVLQDPSTGAVISARTGFWTFDLSEAYGVSPDAHTILGAKVVPKRGRPSSRRQTGQCWRRCQPVNQQLSAQRFGFSKPSLSMPSIDGIRTRPMITNVRYIADWRPNIRSSEASGAPKAATPCGVRSAHRPMDLE